MTKPPKTAASPLERATIYTLSVWAHREMVPKHMTDAFLAGYTEGQRDAYASVSQVFKDAEYVLAGSRAIEGQDDSELDAREAALMRFLEAHGDLLQRAKGES